MIQVTLNRPDFEYDIHSLVKAFYPGQEVQVSAGEKVCEESPDLKIRIDYLVGQDLLGGNAFGSD